MPTNLPQVSGAVDRIALVLLTYLATKGYITTADIGNYVALIVGIVGAVYSFYINRNTNIVSRAGNVADTTIVTTPTIAAATPTQTNIVSNTETKVVTK